MKKHFSPLKSDTVIGLALSLGVFCVYLATLGPSTGFIDAGELAAVAYTFGVAHPTGYPLFTLVAGFFSHLPVFPATATVIWRLNLFAAFCCAASVFFFFRVFLMLLTSSPKSGRAPKKNSVPVIAAAIAALTLAFSRTFWSQSVGVEVYSLHLLLVSLVLFLFLKALPAGAFTDGAIKDPAPQRRLWFAFAFVLGLSFANHMTTLLLLPGLIYLYFAVHGLRGPAWKNAGLSLPFFCLGLLPYLYLPLRAAAHPALNWGAITDFRSFMWHISGQQYSGWMFSSLEPAGRQFALFVDTLPEELGYLALLPALGGIAVLFLGARRLFGFIGLLFTGCLLYSINYDIADIASYFLLAYIALAAAAAFGVRAALEFAGGAGRRSTFLTVCALAALCFLLPLALHYREVDESGNYATEDYARNLLNAAEPGALILTTQWDHFLAAAYYLQLVEGVRPDVVLVDRELLKRSWYIRYLSQRQPWLIEASRAEVNRFTPELEKFEQGAPYDGDVVQATYVGMIRGMLANSFRTRPVYVTPETGNEYMGPGLQRIPAGGLLRVYAGEPPVFVPREMFFRPFPKDNVYFGILRGYYANGFANQGLYLGMRGDLAGSEYFLRKALVLKPESPEIALWLRQVRQAQQEKRALSGEP